MFTVVETEEITGRVLWITSIQIPRLLSIVFEWKEAYLGTRSPVCHSTYSAQSAQIAESERHTPIEILGDFLQKIIQKTWRIWLWEAFPKTFIFQLRGWASVLSERCWSSSILFLSGNKFQRKKLVLNPKTQLCFLRQSSSLLQKKRFFNTSMKRHGTIVYRLNLFLAKSNVKGVGFKHELEILRGSIV